MLVLTQFALRLSFGLALAMALTSPKKVTSGYFRNHSYVLLGLCVLAALAAFGNQAQLVLWPPLVAAALSYLCAAIWLYEKPAAGLLLLWAVAAVSLLGCWLDQPIRAASMATAQTSGSDTPVAQILWHLDPLTGGLVLGSTIAAMFLGHWYLNTPTMEIGPLGKLLALMALSILCRAIVSGLGLAFELNSTGIATTQWFMLALRWIAGIAGTAVLTWMAWQTLKIPNTQSATGILYVAVITTFIGELSSLLLSASTAFPL